jgi:hypothetical protein
MDLQRLPGGDQDVLAALAPALLECLRQARRVILLANNPAIAERDFAALAVTADDVVVSFNNCVKADLLSSRCSNIFVHGFNAPDRYFFGLPYPRPEARRLFDTPGARCFSVLVGCTGDLSPMPGVTLLRERIPLPALWNYPVERPDGKTYVGPSSGFNALVLFDWLRREHGCRYQLLTLGFSNEAGKLWRGHAWDYERQWLLSADVQAIALQRRSWWQRLLNRH